MPSCPIFSGALRRGLPGRCPATRGSLRVAWSRRWRFGCCRRGLRPFGWRVGRCCKSCGCFAGTGTGGTGTSSRGLGHGRRRRRDNVSASTGKRAGAREKRLDRHPRRGSSSYRWGRSRKLVRPTAVREGAQQLPSCWCPHRSGLILNWEWYPSTRWCEICGV